jgi:hypothetical protein
MQQQRLLPSTKTAWKQSTTTRMTFGREAIHIDDWASFGKLLFATQSLHGMAVVAA